MTNKLHVGRNYSNSSTFEKGNYVGYTFQECNFRQADLTSAKFRNCVFNKCDFTDAVADGSEFLACNFQSCTFERTSMTATSWRSSNIDRCNFKYADLSGAILTKVLISSNTILDEADFTGAALANVSGPIIYFNFDYVDSIFTKTHGVIGTTRLRHHEWPKGIEKMGLWRRSFYKIAWLPLHRELIRLAIACFSEEEHEEDEVISTGSLLPPKQSKKTRGQGQKD